MSKKSTPDPNDNLSKRNSEKEFSLILEIHDLLEDHLDDESYTIDHLCKD